MPQMAPLNWLILFFFFVMIFLIFNSLNFYSFIYSSKSKKPTESKPIFNWKW